MSAIKQITELVHNKLAGRKIDPVGFVDDLLILADGEIHCSAASDHVMRFEMQDGEICDLKVDACRGKVRMLCARIGVLCNEASGAAVSAYGGEGTIVLAPSNGAAARRWEVRFKNTPDEHEFTIIPAEVTA